MAGVIVLVAFRLIQFSEIAHVIRSSSRETGILLTTFGTGLLVDLEFSIYAGVLLSILLFLRWTATPMVGVAAPDPSTKRRMFRNARLHQLKECPQLVIVRLHGLLYFGSVEYVRRYPRVGESEHPSQRHVLFVPMTSAETDLPAAALLIAEAARWKAKGGSFNIVVKTPRSRRLMNRVGVVKAIGHNHVFGSKGRAIEWIVPTLDQNECAGCTARIFGECPKPATEGQKHSGDATEG